MITAFIRRLSTTTIHSNVGTKQTLYTVPADKVAVITHVVVRGPSTSLSTILGTLSFGFNSSSNDWSPAYTQAELRTLTLATHSFLKAANAITVTGAPAQNFGTIFSNIALDAQITIDVFGYTISGS